LIVIIIIDSSKRPWYDEIALCFVPVNHREKFKSLLRNPSSYVTLNRFIFFFFFIKTKFIYTFCIYKLYNKWIWWVWLTGGESHPVTAMLPWKALRGIRSLHQFLFRHLGSSSGIGLDDSWLDYYRILMSTVYFVDFFVGRWS